MIAKPAAAKTVAARTAVAKTAAAKTAAAKAVSAKTVVATTAVRFVLAWATPVAMACAETAYVARVDAVVSSVSPIAGGTCPSRRQSLVTRFLTRDTIRLSGTDHADQDTAVVFQ